MASSTSTPFDVDFFQCENTFRFQNIRVKRSEFEGKKRIHFYCENSSPFIASRFSFPIEDLSDILEELQRIVKEIESLGSSSDLIPSLVNSNSGLLTKTETGFWSD